MTISSLPAKNNRPDAQLSQSLEKIGVQEISLWKEMVLKDESLFNEIYSLIYCDNPRLAWHAAWVIDHVSEADPSKLEIFVPEMMDHLPQIEKQLPETTFHPDATQSKDS